MSTDISIDITHSKQDPRKGQKLRVDGLIDMLYAVTFQPELCIGPDGINHPYFTNWQKVVIVFQRVDPIWSDRSRFSEQLAKRQFK